jgi:hypothetical protein
MIFLDRESAPQALHVGILESRQETAVTTDLERSSVNVAAVFVKRVEELI